jgi:hypothetical protein
VRDGYDPLQYVRDYYKVPAYVGRVVYAGGKRGVVVGASGPHLKVNLDGARHPGVYHPTDSMRWTEETAPLPKRTRSQRNYDAYLHSETTESFIEFMRNPYWNDLRRRTV